ncbi:hypothetical protein [Streptomyces galbus]|uniref:Lipoprotein n=1 Tax=Streptomyces galbus TaxID=33898 RepID=A0A4U5X2G1_STRGB|nr:hypothetical protein [Streptomyces galbus]TKT08592.1 hypothetical protein E4U92_13165 [Streptomyces galbus]GHD23803.1 hypothetical protein GCM10010335_06720 [Streptomyces galbus]
MSVTSSKSGRRPGAVRAAVLAACAVGTLVLTGCNGDDVAGADTGTGPTTAGTAVPSPAGTGGKAPTTAAASKKPATGATSGSGGAAKSPGSAPAASASSAPEGPGAAGADDDGCDHKMPISPDEVAVYRYTPEGGSLSLIVKHGNWGCGSPDSDGPPFETVGKETFIPMDQAAYVTVTNPIVESTENQHIGVQEFLDWLEANPDSGLVFTYHLGADGAIDRLDEVFTP